MSFLIPDLIRIPFLTGLLYPTTSFATVNTNLSGLCVRDLTEYVDSIKINVSLHSYPQLPSFPLKPPYKDEKKDLIEL